MKSDQEWQENDRGTHKGELRSGFSKINLWDLCGRGLARRPLPSQPELSSYCDLIRRGWDRTCLMRRAFSLCTPTNRRISLNPEQFADMKIETQFQRTQKKCQISCGKSLKIWTMARCSCTGSWFANHISEAESYQRGRFSVVFWKAWFLQTIILNKTTEFNLKKMWARSPNQNLHQL